MDEPEPKEQFEATEYDKKGNIAPLSPPPIAAKKKRVTIADLQKDINDIEELLSERIPEILAAHQNRLDKLEEGSLTDRADVAADIAARLDNMDAAIGALATALRSHIEEPAATPPEPAAEIEFAQPPQTTAGGTADISDIGVVAAVCQTMTDVLTITRALKEVPELTDAERKEILYIAGRASGVIITPGLQIRAGVKFTGA
jgi:hypothetical protein